MFRLDYQFAYISTLISNLAIGIHGKKGTKLHEVSDFLIKWDVTEEKPKQTVEEMKQFLLSFAETTNKRHNQKNVKK